MFYVVIIEEKFSTGKEKIDIPTYTVSFKILFQQFGYIGENL